MGLMGNCRDVTRALAEDQGAKPNLPLSVRLHLFMCRHCSRYRQQLQMISSAANSALKAKEGDDAAHRELRARILGNEERK